MMTINNCDSKRSQTKTYSPQRYILCVMNNYLLEPRPTSDECAHDAEVKKRAKREFGWASSWLFDLVKKIM